MAGGDYVHGAMDIGAHKKTFATFWTLTKWGTVLSVLLMIGLAALRTNQKDCTKPGASERYLKECGRLLPAEDGGHSE